MEFRVHAGVRGRGGQIARDGVGIVGASCERLAPHASRSTKHVFGPPHPCRRQIFRQHRRQGQTRSADWMFSTRYGPGRCEEKS